MKLRKADSVFSKVIKKKRGYKCERCGAIHDEKSRGLHLAHFHGRRKESTRFDEENVDILCYGCHSYFHQNPDEHKAWKKLKLGKKKFDLLTIRANTPQKKDDKLVIMIYKKELDES